MQNISATVLTDIPDSLDALRQEILTAIDAAQDAASIEEIRVSALGKKGRLTEQMKTLGTLPPDERKEKGAALNVIKDEVAAKLAVRQKEIAGFEMQKRLEQERVDVTLSVRPQSEGRIHPITQTIEEIVTIFASMGFAVAKGPDIESDYYNFTALNIPPDHPARQMQSSFYLPEQDGKPVVLRTQTSPVQIRTMQKQKPPIRIIAPGRTYRVDYDMTHTPMFHQFEGLVLDEVTHMGHLKGCLLDFLRAFFGIADLPIRFRPSYFPFTEPSAEVDIGCSRKNGELKLGNYGDWLEIGGCGMVHPNVLKHGGIDAEQYQGFAFGMGVERLAMLKYGIPDLRTFFEADTRWLKHYGFVPLDIPNPALKG
ncbi:MAG: phenylalanine--tRNA ligase subunit alpha [Alphaproteobacteria bacterium]|nr:phenylalanine--tRNA ligase subunit alpha [Alphaproteobacteria bacterium]